MRRAVHSFSSPGKFLRAALRQLRHIALHKRLLWQRRGSIRLRAAVYFTTRPHPYTVCYRLLHRLGIPFRVGVPRTNSPALVFLWQDSTYVDPLPAGLAGPQWTVVNSRCLDISKQHVNRVHEEVFGYSLQVDPLTYTGAMVQKSNRNGRHDGRVMIGPVACANPESQYQRVVENLQQNEAFQPGTPSLTVCDLRLPVFGDDLPFVYLKVRARENRFSNRNTLVSIAETASLFSPQERVLIGNFCQRCGLDYGELDVVRDAVDGRIYILDINKTPLGPPNGLPPEDVRRALAMYETAYVSWFQRLGLMEKV
jgi:hypothetical protein